MRVPLFFICLFFVLLKVGAPLPALATHPAPEQAKTVLASGISLLSNDAQHKVSLNKGNESENAGFVFDDAEDEDADEIFHRKFRLVTRAYSEFIFQDESGCPLNRSKAAPSFFGRFPSTYLLLRVLRV